MKIARNVRSNSAAENDAFRSALGARRAYAQRVSPRTLGGSEVASGQWKGETGLGSHLIYHPRRAERSLSGVHVFFDPPRGNQDPYIWNDRFLHSFCHLTELRNPERGDINYWVSDDNFRRLEHLYCDLVFVVDQKYTWPTPNAIARTNPIVDSPAAFQDHYSWVRLQHQFKRRRHRFTLKAHSSKSFQPQNPTGKLIDIAPFLGQLGLPLSRLHKALTKGFASQPFPLDDVVAKSLYKHLQQIASVKLRGSQLRLLRAEHPELASRQDRSALR